MNIAITGYYGTGSSAVIDLLAEYEGCSEGGLHSYEHVPLYFPNGLFDLEHKLLYGNDPHRSDEAIKSFRKAMYDLNTTNFEWCGTYQKKYGDQFKNIVDKFIGQITQYTCYGQWYNYYEKGGFKLSKFVKDCIKTVLPGKKVWGEFGKLPPRPITREMEFSFIDEEKFYEYAKEFIRNYFNMINHDNAPFLLVDHLLFPHNAYKIDKYFDDDFRLIVLERDIRDMYVLCKYVWASRGYDSPYPNDPESFLAHWTNMRNAERKTDNPNVLYVQFEDLVYNYDQTVAEIEKFLGLSPDQHIHKKTRFIPERSIDNTQNFRIEKEWEEEVAMFVGKTDEIYEFPFERKVELKDTFDEQE